MNNSEKIKSLAPGYYWMSQKETTDEFTMTHRHLSKCRGFDYICNNYDFAIAQVGSNFKPKEIKELTKGSYWLIKGGKRDFFEKCDYSFLDGMNTAFKSLSKNDIIKAYKISLSQSASTELNKNFKKENNLK
jgi:hypothetical protein